MRPITSRARFCNPMSHQDVELSDIELSDIDFTDLDNFDCLNCFYFDIFLFLDYLVDHDVD